MINQLSIADVRLLRQTGSRFGEEWIGKKKQLLQEFSNKSITGVKVLVEYHDSLLFLLAYPETSELFSLTTNELYRTADFAQAIFQGNNQRMRTQLSGSGIAFTPVNVAFSFDMVEWLSNRYPHQVSIFECAAEKEKVKEVLSILLLKTELEGFEKMKFSLLKFIQLAKGQSPLTDLQWLMQFIRNKDLPVEVRDHLYDSLKVYVSWLPDKESPSRTFARSLPRKIYFHKNELKKQVNAGKIIGEPIGKPLKISLKEKSQLVTTSRGILGMLQRETDPVTYADTAAVEYFDMGRGIDIALYPMVAERRLPFDSYIGYTAFKNRLPMAYGGGWIFQERCKIGVNVLESYRGGESAYLFCQILRLYHHHYQVNRFVVEPYQIGHKNLEGLKSGAFWFYYRLGFIPEDDELKLLAAGEFNRIKEQKGYRSSLAVMKRLSTLNMELILDQKGYHHTDVVIVSEAITRMINERFEGDRGKAEKESQVMALKFLRIKPHKTAPFSDRQPLLNFSLLLQLFPGLENWSRKDKLALAQLIMLKGGGSEEEYIRQFQRHKQLNMAISVFFKIAK